MTQHRPYRDSVTPDDAIAELRRNADAQFDAEVVAALVWVLDRGDEDYRLARAHALRPSTSTPSSPSARRRRGTPRPRRSRRFATIPLFGGVPRFACPCLRA